MSKLGQIMASVLMAMQSAKTMLYTGKVGKRQEPNVGVRHARALKPATDFYRHLYAHKKVNGRYKLFCAYGTKHYPAKQWGRHTLKTFADLVELEEYLKENNL